MVGVFVSFCSPGILVGVSVLFCSSIRALGMVRIYGYVAFGCWHYFPLVFSFRRFPRLFHLPLATWRFRVESTLAFVQARLSDLAIPLRYRSTSLLSNM